jgi:predicted NBD/HSP70 family sugar kinase
MAKNSLSLPDNVVQLLSAADARAGLPTGTMFSVMQQESGGQFDRFLADPSTPHYTPDAGGQRKSSAFGPFGILESTAKDPGFGVTPLRDKSLEEQLRFASDYLAGRVKAGGGDLKTGLAGYGEGNQYADQVLARVNAKAPAQAPAPVVTAAAPAPVVLAQASEAPFMPAPADPAKDLWNQYLLTAAAKKVEPGDLAYGPKPAPATAVPAAANPGMSPEELTALYDIPLGGRPNFGVFQGLARLGRRSA